MIIIGLTGSIGAGKSTVTNYLLDNFYKVIDTDKVARDVVEIGEDGYYKLIDYFGDEIVDELGRINRKKLSEIVFKNPKKLKMLNSMLHPIIIEKIKFLEQRYKLEGEKIIFVDAPLLIESGLYKNVDKVLLIGCSEDIQLERIMKRDNISHKKALEIIRSQMSFHEKKKYADFIIMNNETKEMLYENIKMFLKELVKG